MKKINKATLNLRDGSKQSNDRTCVFYPLNQNKDLLDIHIDSGTSNNGKNILNQCDDLYSPNN